MSDNYQEWEGPEFAPATDPETEGPYCAAGHELSFGGGHYSCTREPAHEGRHEAGIGASRIAAAWDRQTATVTTETPRSEP